MSTFPPIGIMGPAGHGKSTVARILADYGGRRVIPIAEPLKQMLGALGLTYDDLHGRYKETPHPLLCGKTPRHAMQTLGVEWGREMLGENVWLNAWRYRVEGAGIVRAIADDVRFPNEVKAIREMGGEIWVVTDPRKPVSNSGHSSEQYWRTVACDVEVTNDGTMEDLKAHVDWLVRNTRLGAIAS